MMRETMVRGLVIGLVQSPEQVVNDRVAAVHPRLVLQPDTFDAAVARFGADPKSVRKEMDPLGAALAKRTLKKKKKK